LALGNLWHEQGKLAAAIAQYQLALAQQPNSLETLNNLATTLRDARRPADAALYCRRALAVDPTCAEAYVNLGLVLHDEGQSDEALNAIRHALELRPTLAAAHNALGTVLEAQEDHLGAVAAFREAVRLAPQFAAAYNNLASSLKSLGKNREAIVCFEEALRINSQMAEAHNGLGAALQADDQDDEALASFQRAIEINPRYAEAYSNIGQLFGQQGHYAAALEQYRQAGQAQPELAAVHNNRAMVLLLSGDFAAGWPEYEWRWQLPGASPRPTGVQWDGSPLEGRTILLTLEQGFGDALQFIRYAPLVKARGGTVIVGCPKRLIPILKTCPGIDRIYGEEETPPRFDVFAPLASLPGLFRTDLTTIPAEVPYLSAPADLVEHWREKLAGDQRLRVGINWQGNPSYQGDRRRSIPLAEFAPLAEVPGVRLLSLQKGFGSEQLANASFDVEDLGTKLDLGEAAFCETAAVLKDLDLLITSDTAIAHLAGALAVPVWLALSFSPDWRWLLDRSDSPWYPTMRLFRQTSAGDWPGVFQRMQSELTELAKAANQSR
jgi:tetratricopeptide (TPR) repeat protein